MGIIHCKTHGNATIVETCPHVAEEINNERYGQFYWAGLALVCEDCLHKHRLERLNSLSVQGIPSLWWADAADELLEMYLDATDQIQDHHGWKALCEHCIAVVQVEQARRNGEDDPFPTYDKTLTSHNRDVIRQLEIQLAKNFALNFALVMPGAYTYPLTTKIYYITEEDKQNRIASFIEAFLQKQELNQAKVLFYEAPVWETISNPDTGSSDVKRDKERLLKEVLLNC